MTIVKLKIKEGDTVKTHNHEIESIDGFQLQRTLKVVKDVFVLVQKDPALENLFKALTEGGEEGESLDSRFISHAIGAFEVLMMNLPEQAYELLSATSGIPLDTLKSQKVFDIFDIYEAVIEENDIEALVARSKKSLAATKIKFNFLKKAKKATEKKQA